MPNALFAVYDDMNDMVAKNAQYNASAGFRVEYLLEAVFFLYIIIRNYSLVPNRRVNVLMLNMALIFCGMLLFFIRSDNGGRLSWYYMIGIISTLTCICTQSQAQESSCPDDDGGEFLALRASVRGLAGATWFSFPLQDIP